MGFKQKFKMFVLTLAISFYVCSDASAVTVGGTCRDIGTTRSIATVVGSGLKGYYYAYLSNGTVWSSFSKVQAASTNGVVRFNFDSLSTSISAGATAIPANYIVAGKVVGIIRQAVTNARVGGIIMTCKIG